MSLPHMSATVRWTMPLDTVELASIEPEIDELLTREGVDDRAAFVSRLVIEEIVRNLIEHTPPYAQDEVVDVELRITTERVTVQIEDSRPPFDPGDAPELDVAAPLEARRAGGMGLHLVRRMADELTYERDGDRNRLTATVARA